MQTEKIISARDQSRLDLEEVSLGPNALWKMVGSVAGEMHKSALRSPDEIQRGVRISKYMLERTKKSRNLEAYKQWAVAYRCFKYLFNISQIPNSLKNAVKRGWYLPVPLSIELAHRSDLYAEGAEMQLDSFLREHFTNEMHTLSQSIYIAFPDRAKIIGFANLI